MKFDITILLILSLLFLYTKQVSEPLEFKGETNNKSNKDTFDVIKTTDNSSNNKTADNNSNNKTADNSSNNKTADNNSNNKTADNSSNNKTAENTKPISNKVSLLKKYQWYFISGGIGLIVLISIIVIAICVCKNKDKNDRLTNDVNATSFQEERLI